MMLTQSLFALGLLTGTLARPTQQESRATEYVDFTMVGTVSGGYDLRVWVGGTTTPTADSTSIKSIKVNTDYEVQEKCTFQDARYKEIEVTASEDGFLTLNTPQPIGAVVCDE